ncbi:MAG: SDR family oxidoreductase [Acidobacteria bacterium]|nr:SDR family oxidoreductase [Acidobacteriota bacterium]
MSRQFENRVALVTGASYGIGLGCAQRFAEEGARVVMLGRNEEKGRAAAEQIRAEGGICQFFRADVSREEDVIAGIDAGVKLYGGLDHLVNNAGVVLVKTIEECTVAEWDRVMDINLKSIFLCCKYALPALRASTRPTIVTMGSISSFVGQARTPAYVASKGGVAMLSKTLALDLARYGIRVNCVCPGITDTPMLREHLNSTPDPERTLRERLNRVPLGKALTAREVADAALYLSGDGSSGITGTTLIVDAGYLAAAEWSNE